MRPILALLPLTGTLRQDSYQFVDTGSVDIELQLEWHRASDVEPSESTSERASDQLRWRKRDRRKCSVSLLLAYEIAYSVVPPSTNVQYPRPPLCSDVARVYLV
mmetsp:Transcript_31849/g.53227  ORF Transcript_31849/g.53227 Transcript_31849/m.53227 type:complete len:104 (+) Transcript_31849:1458-1769(+)